MSKIYQPKSLSLKLLFATLILTALGLLMVFNSSSINALQLTGNKLHFFRLQLIWSFIGLVAMVIMSRLKIDWLRIFSPHFLALAILFLFLVLLPGFGHQVSGARRWLQLGSFRLQPSELVKLSYLIYLSAWLTKKPQLKPFLLLTGLILGLIMLEPDLGTALVISVSSMITLFLSGFSLAPFLSLVTGGILAILLLIIYSPYRRQRLLTFLNPQTDLQGSSYHINQILIALGSGGFSGLGLGQSRQKFNYLPEVATDSIFAIWAEETGFLGSLILIALFTFFLLVCFRITQSQTKKFNFLLAGSLTAYFAAQIILNLAGMVAMAPLTGIPLPFISYGGSSLIINLTAAGILLNLARRT